MPQSFVSIRSLFRWRVVMPGLLGILILTTIGLKAHVWRISASANQPERSPNSQGAAQVVRFTVYDAGIFPRELRTGAGFVAIYFDDMSGGSVGLAVATNTNQLLAQVARRPERGRGNGRMRLEPGTYTVYDVSRPSNQATLIVEP